MGEKTEVEEKTPVVAKTREWTKEESLTVARYLEVVTRRAGLNKVALWMAAMNWVEMTLEAVSSGVAANSGVAVGIWCTVGSRSRCS